MYTYNLFVFGHDLSVNEELNNNLNEFDIDFRTTVNGKEFEVSFPYHGGQCNGDVLSCVFGIKISDDDQNPKFINEVRNAKEEDYLADYNIFLEKLMEDLNESIENFDDDGQLEEVVSDLVEFLKNNKPGFYQVEASS